MKSPVDFTSTTKVESGMQRRNVAGEHHADLVGKDLLALVVDDAAAVAVAVEAEPHRRAALQHLVADGVQHLQVFGIGIVARESVVELGIERHDVDADRLQHAAARRRRPCRCRRRPPP